MPLEVVLQLVDAPGVFRRESSGVSTSWDDSRVDALHADDVGAFIWMHRERRGIWSRDLEAMFGFLPNEFDGSYAAWIECVHPEDRAGGDDQLARALTEEHFTVEFRVIRPDLSVRWIRMVGRTEHTPTGEPTRSLGIGFDTTELRESKEAMRQATERFALLQQQLEEQRQQLVYLNRVAMVGSLSASIAHELRQPLTANLANALAVEHLVDREPIDIPALRAIAHDLIAASRQAGAVITGVTTMLQRRRLTKRDIDVNELVADVLSIARNDLLSREVTVRTTLDAERSVVRGDLAQIKQVLLNLVVNACDAMADVDPASRQLGIHSERRGHLIQLSISDRGPGIAPELMPRLFEPFVSSKEHGLGLGLAISRAIADAHGGFLWAENNIEGGTTFHFSLPHVATG